MSEAPIDFVTWKCETVKRLGRLSAPVAKMVAQYSYGMAKARTAGRTTVSVLLGMLFAEPAATVEQRIYDWMRSGLGEGEKPNWQVASCFGPLLGWIVSLWQGRQIALALDATTLSDVFLILTISVVYRGVGLPVAWKILPANRKGRWKPEWLNLIAALKGWIPESWKVLVLTDRGLYAHWLFHAIVDAGWHPFMRVNGNGCFQPDAEYSTMLGPCQFLSDLVRERDKPRVASGVAFSKRKQLRCNVLTFWGQHHRDPWIVLTDLPLQQADINCYALRAWCEQGFKCIKRGLLQWHYTRVKDPARAERVWLAIAVAMLWLAGIGTHVEDTDPSIALTKFDPKPNPTPAAVPSIPKCYRAIRILRLGFLKLLADLERNVRLVVPTYLCPEPWPTPALSPLPPPIPP